MTKNPDDQYVRLGEVAELDTDNAEVRSCMIIRPQGDNIAMFFSDDDASPVQVDTIFVLDPVAAIQISDHLRRLALQVMGGIN